jgi:hypothetical protein
VEIKLLTDVLGTRPSPINACVCVRVCVCEELVKREVPAFKLKLCRCDQDIRAITKLLSTMILSYY